MNQIDLSAAEAFHNTFFYFLEGLGVMASDAASQRQSIGGAHVAWELHNDVLENGEAVLRYPSPFLQEDERSGVVALLDKMRRLPPDALASSEQALEHPDWQILRREAARLLERLARCISVNRAFLESSKPR